MILDKLAERLCEDAYIDGSYDHVPTPGELAHDVLVLVPPAALVLAVLWLGCFWAAS
jgi:hypothetical protein